MSAWLKGWRDSASRIVDSASHMKIGIELDELDEQLGESDEDCRKLDELDEQLGESVNVSPN